MPCSPTGLLPERQGWNTGLLQAVLTHDWQFAQLLLEELCPAV